MANAKAAKKVKVRIGVAFNDEGNFDLVGYCTGGRRHDDARLLGDMKILMPHLHHCLVDIELEVPQQPKGKVLKVKAVKR